MADGFDPHRSVLLDLDVDRESLDGGLLDGIDSRYPLDNGSRKPFGMHGIEVQHAVDLLQSKLPDADQDTYSYLQFVQGHLIFLDEDDGFLNLSPIREKSELKGRVSENFGAGLSSLFMHKVFGVPWETIEQIPATAGSRPDFRCRGQEGQYVYEAKGTTDRQTQSRQIERGKKQKEEYEGSTTHKLVLSTYLHPGDNEGDRSELHVTDPPFGFDADAPFRQEAERKAQKAHFRRVVSFALGRGRASSLRRTDDPDQLARRWSQEEEFRRLSVGDETFIGRESEAEETSERLYFELPESMRGVSFYRGISLGLLTDGARKYKTDRKIYPDQQRSSEVEELDAGMVSRFSDGSILKVEVD